MLEIHYANQIPRPSCFQVHFFPHQDGNGTQNCLSMISYLFFLRKLDAKSCISSVLIGFMFLKCQSNSRERTTTAATSAGSATGTTSTSCSCFTTQAAPLHNRCHWNSSYDWLHTVPKGREFLAPVAMDLLCQVVSRPGESHAIGAVLMYNNPSNQCINRVCLRV